VPAGSRVFALACDSLAWTKLILSTIEATDGSFTVDIRYKFWKNQSGIEF
jgi:hypothetical protein